MTLNDPDGRAPGPLARVGQSESFAGLTRIGILVGGALLAWAGFDFRTALSDIHDNQQAIIRLAERTTRVEDATTTTVSSVKEFRLWTEGQIQALGARGDATDRRIYDVESAQGKSAARVQCLEHHMSCPQ